MEPKKVIVGLSGGVDSAVTAFLLKKQGYKVIGAFMKNFSETKNKITRECLWLEDKKMAQKVASHLRIPLLIFDFEKEYKKNVVKKMISDYSKGLTPNPDSLCNQIIKFPLFWKEARKHGADLIAMGHYVKSKKKDNEYGLYIPKDKTKDQSYFLYQLKQSDLEHTLFPIGDYTKEEVRRIARENKFPNYERKGTVGICFVGKVNLIEFLGKKLKEKKGKVLTLERNVIGEHPGVQYFTEGQRIGESKGFKIDKNYLKNKKRKLYIVKKDIKSNTITIAPEGSKALLKKDFLITNLSKIKNKDIPLNCKIRIRHLGKLIKAKLNLEGEKIICTLQKPVLGLSQGQSAVIYNKSEMIGGGEIKFN